MPRFESGKISLSSMRFYGYHGCLPEERKVGQHYFVDVDFYLDLTQAARHDELVATIDYGEVFKLAQEELEGPSKNLIETLAFDVANRLMEKYHPDKVAVRVRKPKPPVGGFAEYAEAEIVLTN
jgi:dihydroneopterin aldolase